MPAIPPDDRRRLIGTLSLLTSDKDGERSAAGLAASRIIKRLGLTWDDVVVNGDDPKHQRETQHKPPPEPKPMGWRDAAEACLDRSKYLTAWEVDFLCSILASNYRTLTEKQEAVMARIWRKSGL